MSRRKAHISERQRRVAVLTTRIIKCRQALLLHGGLRRIPHRALPLDLTETRPIEAAFYRNMRAVLAGGSTPNYCE